MRKRTISYLFDTIFWYIVYSLPLILLLLYVFRTGSLISLSELFSSYGLSIISTNSLLLALEDLFMVGGVLPIFATNDILIFGIWFVGTMILHLFIDFLLFIPRLAHKWLNWLCKEDE